MKLISVGIFVTNAYIAAFSVVASFVPLPTTGPGFNLILGMTVAIAIATVLLMATMLIHMLRSRLDAGQKFTWCLVFLVTAFVGSTAYYVLVYRHSPEFGAAGSLNRS